PRRHRGAVLHPPADGGADPPAAGDGRLPPRSLLSIRVRSERPRDLHDVLAVPRLAQPLAAPERLRGVDVPHPPRDPLQAGDPAGVSSLDRSRPSASASATPYRSGSRTS